VERKKLKSKENIIFVFVLEISKKSTASCLKKKKKNDVKQIPFQQCLNRYRSIIFNDSDFKLMKRTKEGFRMCVKRRELFSDLIVNKEKFTLCNNLYDAAKK